MQTYAKIINAQKAHLVFDGISEEYSLEYCKQEKAISIFKSKKQYPEFPVVLLYGP